MPKVKAAQAIEPPAQSGLIVAADGGDKDHESFTPIFEPSSKRA
jgi:hypothetical protein